MKKIISFLSLAILTTTILIGCSLKKASYSKEEEKIITFANEQIESIYKVKIDKSDFDYSVGKQVAEDKYEKISEGDNPKIIAVTAKFFEEPKKDNVIEYSLIYNAESKEIISSNINKKE